MCSFELVTFCPARKVTVGEKIRQGGLQGLPGTGKALQT